MLWYFNWQLDSTYFNSRNETKWPDDSYGDNDDDDKRLNGPFLNKLKINKEKK